MLYFLECMAVFFFSFLVFKEIIIPWWQGGQAFPVFRKRRQLEGKRAEAVEAVINSEISEEIKEIKAKTKPRLKDLDYTTRKKG